MFLISLYDFENGRQNLQGVLISTLETYLWPRSNNPPLNTIVGAKLESAVIEQAVDAVMSAPTVWFTIIGVILVWAIFYVVLEILTKGETTEKDMPIPCIVMHVMAITDLIFIIVLCARRSNNRYNLLFLVPPEHRLILSGTSYELHPTAELKRQMTSIARRYLPKDRYWLDQRKDPVYPAVHGDIYAFCAYNPTDSKCSNLPQKPKEEPLVSQMPNVVFIVYESENPFTYLINDNFINEHAAGKNPIITDTPFYDSRIMTGLAKLAKKGITFSGVSSFGLPTFSGWHGLQTGISAAQSYMNVISATKMHTDDVPAFFHSQGYRTFSINGAPPEFDGLNYWINRRSKRFEAMTRLKCRQANDLADDPMQIALMGRSQLKECSEEEIQKEMKKIKFDPPTWFDFSSFYFPNEEQRRVLGVEKPEKAATWTPDRIISSEFQYHFRQQKEVFKKPIFGLTLTTDAHVPYTGFDSKKFYMPGGADIKSRFEKVNHYSDHYMIDEIIDFLQKYDNNTIVVVTGDHGTRDVPLRSKNGHVTDEVVFSSDCVDESTGIDSLFITSGVIGYLGSDPKVREVLNLDKMEGKTLKLPADHNDLTYTLMDTISKLEGKSLPPTYRRSRNLAEIETDDWPNDDWQSVSHVSGQAEYRQGARYLRVHPNDAKTTHYYDHLSFPSCLKENGAPDHKLGGGGQMFADMYKYLDTENYLSSSNRMFNFQFKDEECIKNGKCSFPEPELLRFTEGWHVVFLFFLMFGVSVFIIDPIEFGIICLVRYIREKNYSTVECSEGKSKQGIDLLSVSEEEIKEVEENGDYDV